MSTKTSKRELRSAIAHWRRFTRSAERKLKRGYGFEPDVITGRRVVASLLAELRTGVPHCSEHQCPLSQCPTRRT